MGGDNDSPQGSPVGAPFIQRYLPPRPAVRGQLLLTNHTTQEQHAGIERRYAYETCGRR